MIVSSFIKESNYRNWEPRSLDIYKKIKPFLKRGDKILDIGSGGCQTTELLIKKGGFEVVPIDIKNASLVEEISPLIFDGKIIPFKNNEFDVSLLITVLHHVSDIETLFREAIRVSKRIIVIEDIYTTTFQKYFTFLMDSFVNVEFFGHPHNNKNDSGWKKFFKKHGLILKKSSYAPFWKYFLSATYYLKKNK